MLYFQSMRAAQLRSLSLCFGFALAFGCENTSLMMTPDLGVTRPDFGVRLDAGIDTGVHRDLGPTPDLGASDAGEADAGSVDMGELDLGTVDTGAPDMGPPACDHGDRGDPDRDRVVLLGHRFANDTTMVNTEIRTMSLTTMAGLVDVNTRLDVGIPPSRIEFLPSGEFALVIGERGEIVSVRVDSASAITEVDRAMLPGAIYTDARVTADGRRFYVLGAEVDLTAGVSVVELDCNGMITVSAQQRFGLRLTYTMSLLPSADRALLIGGQAVFDPVDPNDTRMLSLDPAGSMTEIGTFDLWGDSVDALRTDISSDGRVLVVPNGSGFSNEGSQVMIANIQNDQVTEVSRIMGMDDAREALFSYDDQTVLITRLIPGRVTVLANSGQGLAVVDEITGVGLAEQMAQVERGTLAGFVMVTSVDPNAEPNIRQLRIDGPGVVTDLGQLMLGPDSPQIPSAIAVMP